MNCSGLGPAPPSVRAGRFSVEKRFCREKTLNAKRPTQRQPSPRKNILHPIKISRVLTYTTYTTYTRPVPHAYFRVYVVFNMSTLENTISTMCIFIWVQINMSDIYGNNKKPPRLWRLSFSVMGWPRRAASSQHTKSVCCSVAVLGFGLSYHQSDLA
jgi:hypothetical protein